MTPFPNTMKENIVFLRLSELPHSLPTPTIQKSKEQKKQTVVNDSGLGEVTVSEVVWNSLLDSLQQKTYSLREVPRQSSRTLTL